MGVIHHFSVLVSTAFSVVARFGFLPYNTEAV
jgi:hypothetical protein